ncbi:MAG: DUF4350 domain-containing protein [Candidatus Verstraetearchaeota archaeon]|nr:DUF4350 domain-containing protein [Candidatus Verstraetearchaeota archaeon]
MLKSNLKLIIYAIIAALIVLALITVILPTKDDFDLANPYWNGLSEFYRLTNAFNIDIMIHNVDPESSILFIIGPSFNITKERIDLWKKYVENGGILVIMDETGFVNYALEPFKIKIDGHKMFDTVFYYNSWRMPKIIDIRDSRFNASVIIMNMPSILNITDYNPNLKILAYSSSFSFLDLDEDGMPSSNEPTGPFPIAVELIYGKGRIIIFSDSSLFINSILNLGDNLNLLKNIIGNRLVIVDSGIWQKTPHSEFRSFILLLYNFISMPEIKYFLIITILFAIYTLINKSKIKEYDEINYLLIKHPDWDKNLLKILKEERNRVE